MIFVPLLQNNIYLLQSRPITTLGQLSNWELLHEMDSPIMSKKDLHSFANVGEVSGVTFIHSFPDHLRVFFFFFEFPHLGLLRVYVAANFVVDFAQFLKERRDRR